MSWVIDEGPLVSIFPQRTSDSPSSAAKRTRAYRQRRRLRLRSVRIRLSDAEIGALVRLSYLGSPDDMRAIGYGAAARRNPGT
jgi:hypothetical protein